MINLLLYAISIVVICLIAKFSKSSNKDLYMHVVYLTGIVFSAGRFSNYLFPGESIWPFVGATVGLCVAALVIIKWWTRKIATPKNTSISS